VGENTHVDLEIHWTNGLIERFSGIETNQLVTVTEAKGIEKAVLPSRSK
jgi:hypothetical protein